VHTDVIDKLERIAADEIRAIVSYGDDGIEVERMEEAARGGVGPESKLPVLRRVTGERYPSEPFGDRQLSVHAFPDVAVLDIPGGKGTVSWRPSTRRSPTRRSDGCWGRFR